MGLYDDHAALYALAFDGDVEDETTWLLERLGRGCRSVLEPGCGPGRHLTALARRGLEVAGLDASPAMMELARRR
jgi:SAM-dependent methyltransferase